MPDTSEVATGLPFVLELTVPQALVVGDLLLKPYIRLLGLGAGAISIPPELGVLLEPVRERICASIRPGQGSRVKMTEPEMKSLGLALVGFLLHVKKQAAGHQVVPLSTSLRLCENEAHEVFVQILDRLENTGASDTGTALLDTFYAEGDPFGGFQDVFQHITSEEATDTENRGDR